jgi:hypothetical protein
MRATSKPWRLPGRVEHRVVARALGAEAEVVADQHVARRGRDQHVVDEGFGLRRKRASKRRTTPGRRRSAPARSQLVAQRGDARRRQFGLAAQAAK